MGYRFSRRIKICKGINLNISKSGIGVSVGARGASVSTGPRGTYLNLGITGSGFSYRKKIDSSFEKENYISDNDLLRRDYIDGSTLKIQIDNDGKELVFMQAPDGKPFIDEAMMRRVKRSDMYKQMLEITRKTKYEYMKQKNASCIEIFKASPKIITVNDVINERDTLPELKPATYLPREFEEPLPSESNCYDEAYKWACEEYNNASFWKKNRLIKEGTEKKQHELYNNLLDEWNKKKDLFIQNEKQIEEQKNKEYQEDYNIRVAERNKTYDLILNPDDDYILDTTKDVLGQLELPVDYSIDYSVANRKIELDIDLPEIEDFPQTECSILSSGKLSIKKKSISDLNKDYATGIVGMSFYFASLLFNISPVIEKITIAGYTQRINKSTGNIEDQYVYSVEYDRNTFSSLNVENIDPLQAICQFEHIIDMNSKFELKQIKLPDSANRKTKESEQIIEKDYYTIENTAQEQNSEVIEKTVTTGASGNSENTIRGYESEYREKTIPENNSGVPNSTAVKVVKIVFISIFLLLVVGCLKVCSTPSKYAGTYNMKTGKYIK